MSDDPTVHIDGYALTYDVDCRGGPVADGWVDHIDRDALRRAVEQSPTVPLTINFGKVIGRARLSVDAAGLRVEADIEPTGMRQVGVDEGIPYHDAIHTTAIAQAARAATGFSASYRVYGQHWSDDFNLRDILDLSIEDVSITVTPDQEHPE